MSKDNKKKRGRKSKTLPTISAQEVDIPLVVGGASCSPLTGEINAAVSLLLNLEAARQGRSVLFLDESKLLFKGGKKGFAKNTKLDFMRR